MSAARDILAAIATRRLAVPTVPTAPEKVGTAQSQAGRGVPTVPTVPTKNSRREVQDGEKGRLLAAIRSECLPDTLLARDDADPAGLAGLDGDTLRAYARALHWSAERRAGRRPPGWGHRVQCAGCGPVYLWAPLPKVAGCPWCWNRRAGLSIPRPPVTCGDCRHFIADPVNPPAGVGTCGLGRPYARGEHSRWPMTRRTCPAHRMIAA